MPSIEQGFTVLALLIIALIAALAWRTKPFQGRAEKVLAFTAFFLLPILASVGGFAVHVEHSKTTEFCLSCHVMEPYGKSLFFDNQSHLAAAHFENGRIDRDHACFTCHTTYTMFGDYTAKIKGLHHVYANYISGAPTQIKLYTPFRNRECLHCHEGARSFEAQSDHVDNHPDLLSNKQSCLDCHNPVHDIQHLKGAKMWPGAKS